MPKVCKAGIKQDGTGKGLADQTICAVKVDPPVPLSDQVRGLFLIAKGLK